MRRDKSLQQKASALREELVANKAEQTGGAGVVEASPTAERQAAPKDGNAQRDLQALFKELVGYAESEMKERPIVAVAAAFAIGLMLGRLLKR